MIFADFCGRFLRQVDLLRYHLPVPFSGSPPKTGPIRQRFGQAKIPRENPTRIPE
jgi:hypothetical protein